MVKKKILLAEDDEDDQQFFLDFLQSRNDIILLAIAQNGVILIEHLNTINIKSELPDFIVLDQNMPKQNGLQTLKLLKQTSRYSHIPIIIYSTYADEDLIRKGAEAGACLVVSKPVSKTGYDQIIDSIFEVCGSFR